MSSELQKEKSSIRRLMPGEGAATLESNHTYQVHSVEPDDLLDDLTRLAAEVCDAPGALLSIVGFERVQHISRFGASFGNTPSEDNLISRAILAEGLFVVSDTLNDHRLTSNGAVSNPINVRFYAGAPLITPEVQVIGVLSVIGHNPRTLNETQARALSSLAHAAMAGLEGRRKSTELEQAMVEREKAFASLTASEERCAMLLRGASDGLWEWNLETNEMEFCSRWKAMLGYEEHELNSRPDEWFNRVHIEDIERVQSEMMSHLLGLTGQFQCEHRVRRQDGTYRWMLSRGLAVLDSNRCVYRMTGSLTDVTEQKQAEKLLLHNAFHDALTGLPNRALFMDRLKHSLAEVRKGEGYTFGVLFLDLDRFKVVNDSLGHQIGDQLLVTTARRLESCLRPGDIVARLGGDEFAVIVDHVRHVSDAIQAAERIREHL